MAKSWYKLSALVLSLLFLFGCAAAPASSTAPPAETSQPWSLPAGGTDEGMRTPEDVEQIPQMAELHLATALNTAVWQDSALLQRVRRQGLRFPYVNDRLYERADEYFHEPSRLYDYIWSLNRVLHENDPDNLYGGNIPLDVLQKMASEAFADAALANAAPNLFAAFYDAPILSYKENVYSYSDSQECTFNLYWQQEGDVRTVVLTSLAYFGEPGKDTYVLEYEKGPEGLWRLRDVGILPGEEEGGEAAPAIQNATLLENTAQTRQIIGGIGSTIVSMDDWDHTVTLTALAGQPLKPGVQTAVEGKLLDYRFRDAYLFLLFDDRVVLLDSSLNIAGETSLPNTLLDVIRREPTYELHPDSEDLPQPWYDPTNAFAGYDVNADLKTFVYSTEEGLYLLNASTGENTLLYTAERVDWPGYPNHMHPVYRPSFALGEQHIWGVQYNYEGPSNYIHCALQGGEAQSLLYADALEYLHHPVGCLGGYFRSGMYYMESSGSLFTGQNHYVAFDQDNVSGTGPVVLTGKLTDTAYPAKQLDYPIEDAEHILALLSDGRIIFEYSGQYYCSLPY